MGRLTALCVVFKEIYVQLNFIILEFEVPVLIQEIIIQMNNHC